MSQVEPEEIIVKPSVVKKKVVRKQPVVYFDIEEEDEKKEVVPTQPPPQGDCSICCQHYTQHKRKPIKCLYCPFEACSECIQRYLLSQADAHCMDCRKMWGKDFLRQHLSKSYVKDTLTKHYANVLADLERSLFPQTIKELEAERQENMLRESENQVNETVHVLDKLRRIIRAMGTATNNTFRLHYMNVGQICISLHDPRSDERIKEINEILDNPTKELETFCSSNDLQEDVKLFEYYVKHLQTLIYQTLGNGREYPPVKGDPGPPTQIRYTSVQFKGVINKYITLLEEFLKKQFDINESCRKKVSKPIIVRCIVEKCPGYVSKCRLTDDDCTIAVCGICSSYSCYECLVKVKGPNDEHKCDPDLLKTIRMIARESKPCPNCKTPIQRTEGCAQMFCTQCHTAFDWTTNQIVTGRIHNPHYFDWLSKQSDEEKKQEAERRNNRPNDVQPQVALDEHGCPIGNVQIFNSQLFSQLSRHVNSFSKRDINNACGQMCTAILLAYQMFTHVVEMDMTAKRVQPDPTLRYADIRKRLLRGDKTYSEVKWRADLLHRMVQNERNHAWYQLLEAMTAIAWNIYQQLVETLNNLFTKHKVNDRMMWNVKATHSVFPPFIKSIQTSYQQLIDLAKYYNENARKITSEEGHTMYYKMIVPHPDVIKISNNDHSDYKLNKHLFQMRTCKISDNELDFKIASELMTTATDEAKQQVETNYTDIEQPFIELQAQVFKLVKQLTDCVANFDQPMVVHTMFETINALTSMELLQDLPSRVQTAVDALTKQKKRTDVVKEIYKSIHKEINQVFEKFDSVMLELIVQYDFMINKQGYVDTYLLHHRSPHRYIGWSYNRYNLKKNYVVDCTSTLVTKLNAFIREGQKPEHLDFAFYQRLVNAQDRDCYGVTKHTEKQPVPINASVMMDIRTMHYIKHVGPLSRSAVSEARTIHTDSWFETFMYGDYEVKVPKWIAFIQHYDASKKHVMFLDWPHKVDNKGIRGFPATGLFNRELLPCFINEESCTVFEVFMLPYLQLESWTIEHLTNLENRLNCICIGMSAGDWNKVVCKVKTVCDTLVDRVLEMYRNNLIFASEHLVELVNLWAGLAKDYNPAVFNKDCKHFQYFAPNVWHLAMSCMFHKHGKDIDFHYTNLECATNK